MVFESIVTEVLNRVLGDYVENLDSNQLSIGIWGGDVVLQNLVLKQTALEDLDLPVQTVYGRLGKLVLKIPWKNLYGAPVEAAVERLYLLVVPNQEVKYDPVKEEKNIQESKQTDLQRIEKAKKRASEQGKAKVDDTFVEKLTTQIIKNVQVKIKDIHIRYEDSITNPGKPFAFGITLSNLSVETTNDQWEAAIISDMLSKIYKILNLDALAVYWNCRCPMYSNLSVDDILKYFEEGIATKEVIPSNYTYILGPINSDARLRLNPKPENDEQPFTLSKVLLNLEMEKLAIGLNKSQFHDIMLLADSMERMSNGIQYRKYRPFLKTYTGHAKEWWKFAYTCVLEETVRRRRKAWDWNFICHHRAVCKKYAQAYQTKLQSKKVPEEVQVTLKECEKVLDVINLVIIRQRIELEVERLEKKSEKKKKDSSWLSSWWGKPATDDDAEMSSTADILKKFEDAMTPEEKSKLYRAIDYQENSGPAEYPEEFVATSCAFVLRCLEIQIRDDHVKTIRVLTTELRGVNCRLLQRPAASAVQVAVKIDQLTVFGLQQKDIIPQLVSSEDFSEGGVLLDVMFETNPLDKLCGQRLHVKSLPLKVIYDARTIIHIIKIFKMPESIQIEQLSAAAGNKLADFKEMSATGMQYAVEKHVIMDLDINLSAPYIILPYGGLYSTNKSVLVVNLGHVKVKSEVRSPTNLSVKKMTKEGTTEDEILKAIMNQSYDKFILELSDLQLLIANENEKWKTCISENLITPMHVLQPVNLSVCIYKCLVSDDPRLPKIKITGELPSIMVNVTEDRVLSILSLIFSLPVPGDEDLEAAPLSRASSRSSTISTLSIKSVDIPKKKRLTPVQLKDDIDDFVQVTDLDIKFEMKQLFVTISKKRELKDQSDVTDKVLQFRCMLLEIDMLKQTFNMDVTVRLGGIGLTQFRSVTQLQIINTPMTTGLDEYLFTVQFTQVNKKSPEFHTKYRSCEQSLQLNFTNLQLQLHQEGLQELLKLSNDFQKSLEKIKTVIHGSDRIASAGSTTSTGRLSRPSIRPSQKLSIIGETVGPIRKSEFRIVTEQTQRRARRGAIVETIILRLTANLEELDVLLVNDHRQLACFAVKGIYADILIKKSYTQILATLTDIVVLDPNPKSIHSQIICRTGTENAIDAQIVIYKNDKKTDPNKTDISVKVTMSGLQITFLNLFVSSIVHFLNTFQAAQQTILEASAQAAESAKMNMQNAYENALRIDINIKIKAPVIIIPTNSKSYDAFMIDLGKIELTNRFINLDTLGDVGNTAVIDELKIHLMDLKMSRILLNKHLEKTVECMLLKPVSLILQIKRNLSASWYNNIPDIDIAGEMQSIELMLSEADYSKIMQVLGENLSEGVIQQDAKKQVKKMQVMAEVETRRKTSVAGTKSIKDLIILTDKQPHTFLRFTFTMDSLVINLFQGGSKSLAYNEDSGVSNHLPKDGLARFTLLVLSVKGRILTDNSLTTAVLLVDCLLDDTRFGRGGKLTRFMERKQEELSTNSSCSYPGTDNITRSMIDVIFQQKESDIFVDIRVFSFNLIISSDYLMKILAFFTPPEVENLNALPTKPEIPVKSKNEKSNTTSKSQITLEKSPESKNITLNLKIEKPDIILVEKMDSIDTSALILNTEVLLNARIAGTNQSIRGSINDLQLYACCYNPAKRNETKFPVLRPCNILVVGTTPLHQGLHLDINVSDIRLSVSPGVIEILSSIQKTLKATDVTTAGDSDTITYFPDIWESKPLYDSNFWFLKTEEGEDAITSVGEPSVNLDESYSYLKQICNIAASTIVLTIEAGVGNKTLPMLLLETSFEASVHDWSSKLHMDSSLTVQMAYYNSRLAVWEPLIEPVEVLKDNQTGHTPWELKVELKKNEPEEQYVLSPQSESEPLEEISFIPPTISVNVSSNVNLELVVTKTLLEVISNLGSAFTNAMSAGITIAEAESAPYRVINDSGLKITVLLLNSDFELYTQEGQDNYKEIVLDSGAEVKLDLALLNNFSDMNLLNTVKESSSFSILHAAEEKNLVILVNEMDCTLTLPVVRADKRYFPLNYRGENKDSWGLISDVTVEGAETKITLRSMLQVHNHFHEPVNIYYMTNRGNELEQIMEIAPNSSCNLPMNAVYTLTNELFFSVQKHSVSAAPYIWKDLQHNLSMVKTLTCPSDGKVSNQSFVMKVCGDIEQIFFENTTKHTMVSTCYNIHLRPAVTFKNCLPVPVICIAQGDVEEFTVKPGETLHMPTINPGSSYIVLRLLNYLEKEWSCKHDILINTPEFTVWQFESHDSVALMELDLGMHSLNTNGTMVLSLYCPFWMLNKTGLMLSYRNSDDNFNILHHPEDYNHPILFSFNAKNFFGKKKAAIRIGFGEWSDKFSLDVAGSSGTVVCKANNMIHQIGVHNQLTYNGLTKQVTFTPHFILINNAPFVIECQELERPADQWIVVQPHSCTPLWPRSERDDKLLKLRVEGTKELSAPFLITEVHTTLLKLLNKYGGVNLDVQATEGGIYVTFTQYQPGLAAALFINHSSREIKIWEKESLNIKKLPSKTTLLHTWDNPTGPRLVAWETEKKKEVEDDLRKDGLGEFTPVPQHKIYWVSFLDGIQRILLFTEEMSIARDAQSAGDLENIDQEITVSIHGLGLSLINNMIRQEIMYIAVASSGVIWEACKMSSKRFKQLNGKECTLMEAAYQQYLLNEGGDMGPVLIDPKTEVDFKNEVMLRPHKRKVRRVFQTGLWLQMKTSSNQMQLHAKINRVQIDNQMYECIFPVILAPVPPPKSVAADSCIKPFAELSIVQRLMKHSSVQQYKYFKVLIQEFHVKVDLGFVNALMAVFEAKEPSENDEKQLFIKDMSLVNEPLMSHVSTQSLQEQKNFYDLLHFSPLKIHVSFSMAAPTSASGSNSGSAESSTPAFLNVLLQGLGVTLTDMQDVVFRLAYFEREYTFLTQRQLTSEATSHYVGQAVKQLYVLVLGLDVIGNPYGLVVGISKGVEDLFYEPFQGAIQGPGEFAEGLVLGVRSLFGHTVGGAAGAVSRITGAMGKGIAALTFDKDYQRKRRDQINKKPANIQEGIARGGKGLVMGVVDGVTGVFTKPITGAKEQGVEGFFKGLGKGAVGLVTRPTAGVIDFASGSLDAVKRATELSDEVCRLRAPRCMQADCLVRPYVKQEAEGSKLLRELEKGKYANTDTYSFHMWIVQEKDILLLTDKRMAYVVHNDIFGGWQVEWSYTWTDLKMPAKVVDKGVQVQAGEPKKKVLGIFGSTEHGKILIIPDPKMREIVKNKIESLRESA